MHYLHYTQKTGWTYCEGDIESCIESMVLDGPQGTGRRHSCVEIWREERLRDYLIVEGLCGTEEFTLVEYINQPIS